MIFYPLKVFADGSLIHFDQVYFLRMAEPRRLVAFVGDPHNPPPQTGFVPCLFIDRIPEHL